MPKMDKFLKCLKLGSRFAPSISERHLVCLNAAHMAQWLRKLPGIQSDTLRANRLFEEIQTPLF